MEMCYRSRGINNFLEIKVGSGREIADNGYTYQVRMAEENTVPYLLRPVSMEMDGILYLRYETNTHYVVDRLLQQSKMNGTLLMNWISQILKCMEQMEKYLLSPDNLVLLPEYMFYSYAEEIIHMVYVPGYEKKIIPQLRVLLEYFMQHFDASDRDGIQLLYGFHAVVCREETDLPELVQYAVQSGMSKSSAAVEEKAVKRQTDIRQEPTTLAEGKDVSKQSEILRTEAEPGSLHRSIHISVGRGIVMGSNLLAAGYMLLRYFRGGSGRAELYVAVALVIIFGVQLIFCFGDAEEDADAAMQEYGQSANEAAEPEEYLVCESGKAEEQSRVRRLVPLTNGALCEINLSEIGEACVVGRGRRETDYRLSTTQISRVHACIYRREDAYFLEDRNSTNGTYINAVRIPAQQLIKLNKGDIVGFANEEFFVS